MNVEVNSKASALISFAAVIVVVYGLQMAKVLMVPLLLAAFIALITVRPMLWMQRHRVPFALVVLTIENISAIVAHAGPVSSPYGRGAGSQGILTAQVVMTSTIVRATIAASTSMVRCRDRNSR